MGHALSLGHLIPRPGLILVIITVLLLSSVWVSCAGVGACVGVKGLSNYCKNGWTEAECTDWNNQGINGATWNFHAGQTCEDLGYTPTP